MRVLLLRVGVLGTMIGLGWIAIANAQRGNDNVSEGPGGDGSTTAIEEHVRPTLTPPTGDFNPLREGVDLGTAVPFIQSSGIRVGNASGSRSVRPSSSPQRRLYGGSRSSSVQRNHNSRRLCRCDRAAAAECDGAGAIPAKGRSDVGRADFDRAGVRARRRQPVARRPLCNQTCPNRQPHGRSLCHVGGSGQPGARPLHGRSVRNAGQLRADDRGTRPERVGQ